MGNKSIYSSKSPKTFTYCPLDRDIKPFSNHRNYYSGRRKSRDIFIEQRSRGGQRRKMGQQIGFDIGEHTLVGKSEYSASMSSKNLSGCFMTFESTETCKTNKSS